uniref:Peptidase S1 domain-containing protein n=1 Tax=Timema poppense TaxID=170557 RepID=A0A7R9DHJ9_TIMPO|nr:unnamed protein product [Timema poppensis]
MLAKSGWELVYCGLGLDFLRGADLVRVSVFFIQATGVDVLVRACVSHPTGRGLGQPSVIGWGYDEFGQVTEELMMATMPIVSQQTCLWSYPQFFSHFTSNKTYCAGFREGTSVCNGDSGGGMVFPLRQSDGSDLWHLRGLVSISVSQENKRICDTSHYVVFTDIAKYLEWIQGILGLLPQLQKSKAAPLASYLSHSIAGLPMSHSNGREKRGGKKNEKATNAQFSPMKTRDRLLGPSKRYSIKCIPELGRARRIVQSLETPRGLTARPLPHWIGLLTIRYVRHDVGLASLHPHCTPSSDYVYLHMVPKRYPRPTPHPVRCWYNPARTLTVLCQLAAEPAVLHSPRVQGPAYRTPLCLHSLPPDIGEINVLLLGLPGEEG